MWKYIGLIFLRELGGIRTPNLLGRNQVHYPVVLRVLNCGAKLTIVS